MNKLNPESRLLYKILSSIEWNFNLPPAEALPTGDLEIPLAWSSKQQMLFTFFSRFRLEKSTVIWKGHLIMKSQNLGMRIWRGFDPKENLFLKKVMPEPQDRMELENKILQELPDIITSLGNPTEFARGPVNDINVDLVKQDNISKKLISIGYIEIEKELINNSYYIIYKRIGGNSNRVIASDNNLLEKTKTRLALKDYHSNYTNYERKFFRDAFATTNRYFRQLKIQGY